jgi:hypothetical protein
MLEGARIRNDAEALRLQVVDHVLELGLAEQIVGQPLLEAHAEIVGDLRPLQVEIDEEHPGVHVLRERQREVDRGHGLALTHRHAGHRDGVPLVHVEATQDARAQDLERAQRRDIGNGGQDALAFHGAGVHAGLAEAPGLLKLGGRRGHAARTHPQVCCVDVVGALGARSVSKIPADRIFHGGAH